MATMHLPEGQPVDLAAFEKATTDAGFMLLWTELKITGQLVPARDGVARPVLLRVSGSGQSVQLAAADSDAGRRAAAALRALAENGSVVRVHGRARGAAGGGLIVAVSRYEIVRE